MTQRGVVVVHGQGEAQFRGGILAELLNGLITGLRRAGHVHALTFDVDARPVRATLTVDTGGPAGPDVFVFREAYWDDVFPAADADAVARWALLGIRDQVVGLMQGWEKLSAGSFQLWLLCLTLSAVSVVLWMLTPLSWFLRSLAATPGLGFFGATKALSNAFDGLNPFLKYTLGDSQRFVTDEAWATAISARIDDAILELLRDRAIDEVIVVAHSAGASVAYAALLEGRPVAAELELEVAAARRPKPIRLVTLGSGLYHMWSFARRDDNGPTERTSFGAARLAPVVIDSQPTTFPFWTDLFARFDYVSAGPLRREIIEQSRLTAMQVQSDRVINYDHLVHDHGGYLRNQDEVIPRLLSTLYASDDWVHGGPDRDGRGYTRVDTDQRMRSLNRLNATKLLPYYLLALHALILIWSPWRTAWDGLGRRMAMSIERFTGWLHVDLSAVGDALA
ncbi:MAG: hypothetical protein EXR68_02490 [Dehalococcoidia bacterium]|nr:hypothetical protein [Dehalococcoidia bacterium]